MRNRSSGSQACRRVRQFATVSSFALSALFSTGPVMAAEQQDQTRTSNVEITPFMGFMSGGSFEDPTDGSDRNVEDDTSYGIFLNLIADVPERQYELFYASQSSAVEGGVPIDLDIQYLQLGGIVSYPQSRHVIPYFGATVGAARFSPDAPGLDDETKIAFSVGGGAKFPITDHIGIRLDIRGFISLLEDDSEIFCVSDPANTSGCLIKPKSDTFVQYTGSLGFTVGF